MMSRWRVVASVLPLLVATFLGADPNPEIALLYVDAAAEALRDDQTLLARQLLVVAREFDSESSDVLYLSAKADATDQDRTRGALSLVRAASEANSWVRFSPLHADVLLAELLNRIGESAEAAALLSTATPAPDSPESLLRDYHYEQLRAISARGAPIDGPLVRARDRFPDDPRLYLYALRRERSPSLEYRREIERLIARSDSSGRESGLEELLYEYAARAPTEHEYRWAVDLLTDRGWSDPRLARVLVVREPERAVEAFLSRGGFTDLGVYFRLLDSVEPPLADRITDAAAAFSGTSVLDIDGDGWWNERVQVENGRIVAWERDIDQDGVVELEVRFGELEPDLVVFRDEDRTVRFRHEQYPYLGEGEIDTELGRERFVVAPRSVRLDVMRPLSPEGPLFDGATRLAESVRRVSERELIAASIQTDHIRADGTIAERYLRQGGTRSRVLRDEDGDGAWDHLLLSDGGFLTTGLRDLDADGYYEVAEAYRNGRLVAVAIDSDDDRLPDVFEQYGTTGSREWDLNEDGRIDVREFSFWTDSVLREFPLNEQGR